MTIDLHLTKYTWNNALITEVCKGDFMIVKSYPKSLRYGKFIAHILTQKVTFYPPITSDFLTCTTDKPSFSGNNSY